LYAFSLFKLDQHSLAQGITLLLTSLSYKLVAARASEPPVQKPTYTYTGGA